MRSMCDACAPWSERSAHHSARHDCVADHWTRLRVVAAKVDCSPTGRITIFPELLNCCCLNDLQPRVPLELRHRRTPAGAGPADAPRCLENARLELACRIQALTDIIVSA